jgi:hypothetical protein
LSLTLGHARPADAQVALVIRAPADHEVAGKLQELIETGVDERAVQANEAGLGATMEQAASWSAAYAVTIDRPDSTVHVLRVADRTVASRVLPPALLADSPYAVALATAELLEWLGAVPPARPITDEVQAGAGPVRDRPASAAVADVPEPDRGYEPSITLGAAFEVTTSPGFDLSLLRPAIGVGLQWRRLGASPFFALGARFAAPAELERELEGRVRGVTSIAYWSADPAVSAAIGFGSSSAALLAQLAFGLSITDVEARGERDAVLARSDAVTPWLGLGLFLRYPLISGFSLAVGAEGQWLTDLARYRVQRVSVLEEGRIRLATGLGLLWDSGL